MRLKSYFAKDVKTALVQARQELGPEAMLVHSRVAPPEARRPGEFEVVFATGAPAAAEAGDDYAGLASEVAALRRELERMSAAMSRSRTSAGGANGECAGAFAALAAAEVDPELAHEAIERLRAGGGDVESGLAAELAARFQVDAALGVGEARPRIAALVGPPGGGKTTTLVKLAVRYGLAGRRPTQLISMDGYRIAASEQLRSYAAILGVGFQALETPAALAQALEEHRRKDLILIDTAGHGARDLDAAEGLARFLASRTDIDTHLVLSAATKSADLFRVTEGFEIFRPRKLLFTRLDETQTFGPLLSLAAKTGKPISFLASGQQIPEDLEPAARERIVDLVWKRTAGRSAAAAA
jgi:flagellar biosynthesis protein FlhF